MKNVLIMIFVLSNLLFSTQLFIDEVPIRFHIRDKILKEAKAKKDYETVDELLDDSFITVTNNNNNIITETNYNNIDLSKYQEKGYDISIDVLPRYYTVVKGDTLFKISSYPFIYGEKNFWYIIYNANKNVLRNKKSLPIGTKLFIPSIRGETRYWTYEPKLEYVPFKIKMDLTTNMYKDYPYIIKTKDD